jgi:hypothetical protein
MGERGQSIGASMTFHDFMRVYLSVVAFFCS